MSFLRAQKKRRREYYFLFRASELRAGCKRPDSSTRLPELTRRALTAAGRLACCFLLLLILYIASARRRFCLSELRVLSFLHIHTLDLAPLPMEAHGELRGSAGWPVPMPSGRVKRDQAQMHGVDEYTAAAESKRGTFGTGNPAKRGRVLTPPSAGLTIRTSRRNAPRPSSKAGRTMPRSSGSVG
jgi:hypothetical protein